MASSIGVARCSRTTVEDILLRGLSKRSAPASRPIDGADSVDVKGKRGWRMSWKAARISGQR
jgi:hypothetical protein